MVKSVWLGWDGTEWSNSSDSDDIEGTNFTTFSSVGIGRPTVRYFRTSLLTNRWTPEPVTGQCLFSSQCHYSRSPPPEQIKIEVDQLEDSGSCVCSIVSIQKPMCPIEASTPDRVKR